MQYETGKRYPLSERDKITKWWQANKQYDINEYTDYIEVVKRVNELIKADTVEALKIELAKIKEDIEQEAFGLVRDDFTKNKARAAAIINELRVLEGKEPREIKLL